MILHLIVFTAFYGVCGATFTDWLHSSNEVLCLFFSPDLPKAALRILSNMTFLFVSLSYTAECAIVTAFITFIPKFIESQFGMPASNASIYTGKCKRLFKLNEHLVRFKQVGILFSHWFAKAEMGSKLVAM